MSAPPRSALLIGPIARALRAGIVICVLMLMPALAMAATQPRGPYDGIGHPEWVRNAAIYEINLRHFTPEGTIAAAERQLPRLKDLGIDIVWLMPVHPSGQVRKVGPLGSPYAVRDFRAVAPDYGTLADLRHFVDTAHGLGLHVILDWVADHSAWDNPLVAQHPDWYAHDANGRLKSPAWFGWNDVVQFDYGAEGLSRYMIDAMAFWVTRTGVDGFRCDAAGLMPLEFWERARRRLDRIKPIFMLAEWESRDLSFNAFDMTYGWSWASAIEGVASGHGSLDALRTFYAWNDRFWPANAIRMLYVSNHDVIGGGTEFERFGPALDAAIALSIVSDGMPLVFNGQEAGNRRRLNMMMRDPIVWRDDAEGALYKQLLSLRKAHPALWTRPWGGRIVEVPNTNRDSVLSFARTVPTDAVLSIFNLSPRPQTVFLDLGEVGTSWTDAAAMTPLPVQAQRARLTLAPWSYRLFTRASNGAPADEIAPPLHER